MYIPILVLVLAVVLVLLFMHGKDKAIAGSLNVVGTRLEDLIERLDELVALHTREALGWYLQLRAAGVIPRVDPRQMAEAQRLIGTLEGLSNTSLTYRLSARSVTHMVAPDAVIEDFDEAEDAVQGAATDAPDPSTAAHLAQPASKSHPLAPAADETTNGPQHPGTTTNAAEIGALTRELAQRSADAERFQRIGRERLDRIQRLERELEAARRPSPPPRQEHLAGLSLNASSERSQLVDHSGRTLSSTSSIGVTDRSSSRHADTVREFWEASLAACPDCADCDRCRHNRQAQGLTF